MRTGWKRIAIALFAASILFGGFWGNRLLALPHEAREQLKLYTELLRIAHEEYGAEVDYRALVESSIGGMLRTLDPHTSFMSSEAYSSMRERQQSSFFGLGILVGMRNGLLTVVTPIEGTPGHRMGLRAGDVISEIEGDPTDGMTLNEAVRRLKGPKGTQVTISVTRPGLDKPLEITITRDEIPQNTVRYTYMLSEDTGYISVSDFNRGTGKEVQEAIARLQDEGMEGLILDLRGNGGGLLDQAIAVSDLFLPDGAKIVETRGRTRDSFQEYYASDDPKALDIPIVILVGQGTASAAEIVAGAVQDHDLGMIVGTPTWGKGLVQTVYSVSNDAGLALTTAKYYTPSGRLIQRDYSSYFDYQTLGNGPPGGSGDADTGLGLDPETGQDEGSNRNRQTFRTDLGREVYGGGGITPDVLVEPQSLHETVQYLLSRSAFFDFAVEWTNTNEVPDRSWQPQAEFLEAFSTWLVEQEISTADEFAEAAAEAGTQETMLRYLKAEVFNSAFGIEARYQVLAEGDNQILRAQEVLEEASELLARRRGLERTREPEVASTSAIG